MFHLAQISPPPPPPLGPPGTNGRHLGTCSFIRLMVHVPPPPSVQFAANHTLTHRKINEQPAIMMIREHFIHYTVNATNGCV